MKLKKIVAFTLFLLTACQSDADRLVFENEGSAFVLGDRLCIGGAKKNNILTYYYLEELKGGINQPLLTSANPPLALRFPENCLKVNLKAGERYGIMYIMNDVKYHVEFIADAYGSIAFIKNGR